MQVIKFKECNNVYAEDQPEYQNLPCHRAKDGTVTSCWSLSFKERLKVLFTGVLFLRVLTFNKPLQPLLMSVDNLVKEGKTNVIGLTSKDITGICTSEKINKED